MGTIPRLVATFVGSLLCGVIYTQTLNMGFSGNQSPMLGEEMCFTVNLEHSGPTGFQPYLRIFLPPDVDFSSLTATFFGDDLNTITLGGTVTAGVVGDPLLADELPENTVPGTDGHRLYTLLLPIGSMVNDGIGLEAEFCLEMSDLAQVDQSFEIAVAPVYRLGNDPNGANGPIVFPTQSITITPQGYTFAVSSSVTKTPVGACWPVEYSMSMDIAPGYQMSNLVLSQEIPSEYKFNGVAFLTPGCFVLETPDVGDNGGTLRIQCDNVLGQSDPVDIFCSTQGYFRNVLNPNSCSLDGAVTSADLSIGGVVSADATSAATLSHIGLAGTTFAPNGIQPGGSVNLGFEFKIEEYVSGLENLRFNVSLPDGIDFANTATLNGSSVSASSVQDLGNGESLVTFNLDEAQFLSCDLGFFAYDVNIASFYENGDMVANGDGFNIVGEFLYDIIGGVSDCPISVDGSFAIPKGEFAKALISSPQNGDAFVPGENVTYRLSATLSPGRVTGITFEDIFPIPIHDVTDLDLTFGNDITFSPLDDAGIAPTNIYIDASSNKLFIEFGDDDRLIERVISVDITLPVSISASSSSLYHINFARFYSSGNDGIVASTQAKASLAVGQSNLGLIKGISDSDNFGVSYSPLAFPVNANANGVDAFDWIDYVITITNSGAAPAYDVIINDFPDTPEITGCYLEDVLDEAGNPVSATGNLFSAGLAIPVIPTQAESPDGNRVFVNYKCQVAGGALSRNQNANNAQVTWAAVPGGTNRFDPVSDGASITIRRPQISTTVVDIVPGYKGNLEEVHVGEVIVFETVLTFPEGRTRESVYECILPAGLVFEDIISASADINVFGYTNGNLNSIVGGVEVSSVGLGVENERRRFLLDFGDVVNTASDNADPEEVVIRFRAVVTNVEDNTSGHLLTTQSILNYRKGSNSAPVDEITEVSVRVRESLLGTNLDLSQTNLSPGQTTQATVSVFHLNASESTAYDVEIIQDLPFGLSIVPGSFLTECESLIQISANENLGLITMKWDSIPQDIECDLIFELRVNDNFPPCNEIDLCADVIWSSAYQQDLDTLDYGPIHPLAYPRTGREEDPGGLQNDLRVQDCKSVEVSSGELNMPVISGSTNVCAGESMNLQVQSYEGFDVQYQWSGPGVPNGFNNNILNVPNATEALEGAYSVVVSIGECSTPVSNPYDVNVVGIPIVSLQDVSIQCANGTDDLVLEALISGDGESFDYFWTGPVGFQSSNPQAVILNVDESDEGTYSLYVSNEFACESEVASSLVQITAAPAPPSLSGDTQICIGDELSLSCTSVPNASAYTWQLPSGIQLTTSTAQLNIDQTNADDDGSYQVQVSANGCTSALSAPLNVNINEIPNAGDILGADGVLCEGGNLALSTDADADEYQWLGPNGFVSNLAAPPVIQNLSDINAGVYSLVITSSACSSPANTIDLEIIPRPNAPIVNSNSPLCVGEEMQLDVLASAQAFEYILPSNEVVLSNSASFSIENSSVEVSGSYLISIFDGFCWSAQEEVAVQVDFIPNVFATVNDSVLSCDGSSALLISLNDPGISGEWTTSHAEVNIVSPNAVSSNVLGLEEGNVYQFEWSLFNAGCGIYSSTVQTVLVPEAPIALADVYEVVAGDPVDLEVQLNDPESEFAVGIYMLDVPNFGTWNVAGGDYVEYRPEIDFFGEDQFIYARCYDDCPQRCDTALVTIDVDPFLGIPDIITPNGDGVNDALRIEGLDRVPEHRLIIHNRWGSIIFEAENYQNDWEGTFNGERVSSGTYFFTFIDTSRQKTMKQGYITIQ